MDTAWPNRLSLIFLVWCCGMPKELILLDSRSASPSLILVLLAFSVPPSPAFERWEWKTEESSIPLACISRQQRQPNWSRTARLLLLLLLSFCSDSVLHLALGWVTTTIKAPASFHFRSLEMSSAAPSAASPAAPAAASTASSSSEALRLDPLAAVEIELRGVQQQISAVETKIEEAEAELKKPLADCELGREYWRDKEKQLRDEKNRLLDEKKQLRDEKLLLLQRTAPAVSSAIG